MPVYHIELKPVAVRGLSALQRRDRQRVARRIDALAHEPRPVGVEKLQGADDLWRIRVGDYRIIYRIHNDRLLILVVRVGNRRDVYR